MNKKIFTIFLLGILFFGLVSAEYISEMKISPESVQYDEGIVDLFDSGQEWVEVGISFKDNSGVELVGTKEEKLAQIKLKDEWFDMEI
ncbi:hypothetical protein GW932_00810, partial [archaeon]|nr:hypothetical protein [archaeon]